VDAALGIDVDLAEEGGLGDYVPGMSD
jgi:hypothetical protein